MTPFKNSFHINKNEDVSKVDEAGATTYTKKPRRTQSADNK